MGDVIVLIDNYDSFTYNLVHLFGSLGAEVVVHRNDAIDAAGVASLDPRAIVLSPGPGRPTGAGVSSSLIRRFVGRLPLLGVCLGHQCLAEHYGGHVVRGAPLHGRTSAMHHDGSALFAGIDNPAPVARYHSLVVDEGTLPDALAVTARSDGAVMAVADPERGAYGVQFHPESFMTGCGPRLASNFLELISTWSTSPTR